MATFGSAGGQSSISIQGATVPVIAQIDMAFGGTEYSYTLPNGTKQYRILLRGLAVMQLSYTLGESGTVFQTIPRGCFLAEDNLTTAGAVTLYFQCNQPGQVVEITAWS